MEFFGFTREEWLRARFDGTPEGLPVTEIVDRLFAGKATGALAGVSPNVWVAIARVSGDFARRLRGQFAASDPSWRDKLVLAARAAERQNDPSSADWNALLSLLDSAG